MPAARTANKNGAAAGKAKKAPASAKNRKPNLSRDESTRERREKEMERARATQYMPEWRDVPPAPPPPAEQGELLADDEWGWGMVSSRPQSPLAASSFAAADTTTTAVDTTTVAAANVVSDEASARELELHHEAFHWQTIARLAQAEVFEARTTPSLLQHRMKLLISKASDGDESPTTEEAEIRSGLESRIDHLESEVVAIREARLSNSTSHCDLE